MNIAVFGTGFMGLVIETFFAETGNNVNCVDIDKQKVERMKGREVPIDGLGLKLVTFDGRYLYDLDKARVGKLTYISV